MFTKPFKRLSKADTGIAGGKGASLGELTRAGIPVPDGFVILAGTFDRFLDEADLRPEVESALHAVDHRAMHTVDKASRAIRALIERADIPPDLQKEIMQAWTALGARFVAVRSSATSEDSADAAWAGQLETYLNTSKTQLLTHVKKCWSSLFTPRAIFYRFEQGLHGTPISVAVVVQKMVSSEKAGIAFSVHPVTQDPTQLIIEAGFGLGEAVVSGEITPDSYVVEKETMRIVERAVNTQTKALVRGKTGANQWKKLGKAGARVVLEEKRIVELAHLVTRIEQHYGFPVDIEWAYERGQFFITQSRPITTLGKQVPETATRAVLWEKVISRNIPPFGWSAGARYEHDGLRIGTVHWKRNRELIVKNNTPQVSVYFDANDLCQTNILDVIQTPASLRSLVAPLNEKIALIDSVFSLTPARGRNAALALLDIHEQSFGYMLMALDLVTEIGLFLDEAEKLTAGVRASLFSPYKSTLIQRENAAIQRAAVAENAPTAQRLEALAETFGFMHQDYMGAPWQVDEYAHAIAAAQNAKRAAVASPARHKAIPRKYVAMAAVVQRLVYLYEEGRNAMVKAASLVLTSPFFQDIDRNVLLHATSEELRRFVRSRTPLDTAQILKRKKYFALYFDRSEVELFSTKSAVQRLLRQLDISTEAANKATKKLKGSIANKGSAKGRARIVLTQKDAESVKPGEIIVSPMTAVEFLSGIRRAGAIVTDEGGVICHAAIVSRELNIPCVIGTHIATGAIRNGDLVHVDANRGIVTIL